MPGKTEAPHEIPYALEADSPASAEEATKPMAERVHERLDDIAPSQIQDQTAGKLLIANASGVITGTAMSGDATISDAGVTKIGAGKVGTTELADLGVSTEKINNGAVTEGKTADGAITSRKAKLTAGVIAATENLTLTTSYQDVPGAVLEITPAVASILKVTAVFDLEVFLSTSDAAAGQSVEALGNAKLNSGSELSQVARVKIIPTGEQVGDPYAAGGVRNTVVEIYAISLTAALNVIKLRAKRGAAGTASCYAAGTAFLYELIAAP
jgi:hypothetical protein